MCRTEAVGTWPALEPLNPLAAGPSIERGRCPGATLFLQPVSDSTGKHGWKGRTPCLTRLAVGELFGHARRAPARLLRGAGLALILSLGGCGEWNEYWDASPTRPRTEPDRTAPTISFLTPSGPDSLHATPVTGDSVLVLLDARDAGGVAGIQLHIDARPAIAIGGPLWGSRWDTTGEPEGSCHALWAVAVDGAGNRATSDTVYARVFNSGPTVAISAPASGARVRGVVEVTASISGSAPDIVEVEFLASAISFGRRSAPPWTASLDTRLLPAGQHFLTVRATTVLGTTGVSQPLGILINNGTPAVSVDFPGSGHRLAARGTLILSGSGSDEVEGALPPGRFTWTSSLDGAIGSGSYLRVRGLTPGTHTITATAINAWNTPGSATVEVEVLAQPTYSYCTNILGEVFLASCASCHNRESPYYAQHELDLTTYAGLMAGGRSRTTYVTVVPCRPESSLVWNKTSSQQPWVGSPMPLDAASLPPDLLEKLRTWILEGAPPDDPEICPF